MSQIISPHDKFFKACMSDRRVAQEFFKTHLPAVIVNAADLTRLTLCPGSYIDDALKLSLSDLLFSVPLAGHTAYIHLLVDHLSQGQRLMPFRLLKYTCRIWDQYLDQTGADTLPLIVPLVFYHGKQPYPYSTDMRDLFTAPKALIEAVWLKPFQLIDTHCLLDEEIKQRQWSGVMEFLLKHIYARDVLPYLQEIQHLLKHLDSAGGSEHITRIFYYLTTAGETGDRDTLMKTLAEGLSAQTRGSIMTIAEQFKAEGRQEGEVAALIRLLKMKFGGVSEAELQRIARADAQTLVKWFDRLLDAKTITDVFH